MKTIRLVLTLFLFAGLSSSSAQDSWTQKADFGGIASGGGVGFSIGNKGYIVSGENPNFWEYDTGAVSSYK